MPRACRPLHLVGICYTRVLHMSHIQGRKTAENLGNLDALASPAGATNLG